MDSVKLGWLLTETSLTVWLRRQQGRVSLMFWVEIIFRKKMIFMHDNAPSDSVKKINIRIKCVSKKLETLMN